MTKKGFQFQPEPMKHYNFKPKKRNFRQKNKVKSMKSCNKQKTFMIFSKKQK